MKEYAKLFAFIAVLLLAVSMMSVAINYLGDITDIDLDLEQRGSSKSVLGEKVPSRREKTGAMLVEAAPLGPAVPLFEIFYPPRVNYLRWRVGEFYGNGEWTASEEHESETYAGGTIDPGVTVAAPSTPVSFGVRPLFNLTEFIPATLRVTHLQFRGTLQRYPSLELFHTQERTRSRYNMTYARYEFPRETLLRAETQFSIDYLEIPEDLVVPMRNLASFIVGDLSTPYEKMEAIQDYLRDNYEYDKQFTPAPDDTDPVEWFLFTELRGACGQFNSALVLLARSLGIPSRTVSGFLLAPDNEYQLVLPKMAHMWVEVPFEGLGWITFDATPPEVQDVTAEDQRIPTVTTILHNDDRALKGSTFNVMGMVTTLEGEVVANLTVEIFLNVEKNVTGILCGVGTVDVGVYDITCDADPSIDVGDYHLVAHAVENRYYQESWSDPPITIMAETDVTINAPLEAYVGEPVTIEGVLLDKSNGQPIPNATVTMTINDRTLNITTDERGSVTLTRTFDEEGNGTVGMVLEDSRYYVGSNTTFGIAVTLRPPPEPSLLQMLMVYPYNMMLAAGVLVVIGAVVLSRRGKPFIVPTTPAEAPAVEVEVEEELPRHFEDYKEGVVKVFNHFFRRCAKRFEDVDASMTPREFQRAIAGKIPESGAPALDYLVTSFEIADYSTFKPTKEMFDKTMDAYELLNGLIEHG